jgi:hypothetical protein
MLDNSFEEVKQKKIEEFSRIGVETPDLMEYELP